MSVFSQILVSGLTLGGLYAVATVGLSLVWASVRMLNLAHGALLAVGGYAAFFCVTTLGFSAPIAFIAAMVFGAFLGWVMFWGLVRPILHTPDFETNILIVTVGLAMVLENGILQIFGGQPYGQPVSSEGSFDILGVSLPAQNIVIISISLVLILLVVLTLNRTKIGLALRCSAENTTAAALMGLPVNRLFAATLAIAGALTAASGVLVSSMTQLSPLLGSDPMLKAFIICVLAGLGNVGGAIIAAFVMATIEVAAQYYFGARWGFPTLLMFVIFILIWSPNGLFSKQEVVRS